ncbi:MAG: hypothetical protein IIA62_03475 [Nitrospinae bacterium]|nr:hypothetical protein [Nitrospinota bacterium]
MKSLATITDKDIETIQMALNDAISDINMELKKDLSSKKNAEMMDYKTKYARVFEKLKQNRSIYALATHELDLVAGALNDAIELLEESLADDLDDHEKADILAYEEECQRLIDILAG